MMRYIILILTTLLIIPRGISQNLTCETTEFAYIISHDGQSDIFLATLDNLSGTNITQDSANEALPRWSPDGNRIAFVDISDVVRNEIVVIDVSGNNRNVIHTQDSIRSLEWSPNGEYLALTAVVSEDGQEFGLFIINMETQKVVRLDEEWRADAFAWSPNSEYLAVQGRDNERVPLIYLVNVENQGSRRLTESYTWAANPTWTQDNQITYVSGGGYQILDPFDEEAYPQRILPLKDSGFLLWSSVPDAEDAIVIANGDIWHFIDGNLLNLTQDSADVMWMSRSRDGTFASYLNMAFEPEFKVNVRILNILTGEVVDLPENAGLPNWRPCM